VRDPEASGSSVIELEEVHERQLDTDLTFAMVHQLGELRGATEPLDIVVMSATLDANFWARLLPHHDGRTADILRVEADSYPLGEQWAPLPGNQRVFDARGVTDTFLNHVAGPVATTAAQKPHRALLAFRPGGQ